MLAGLVMLGVMAASVTAFGQEAGEVHAATYRQHGDFYELFNRYWWLLFPLGWAVGQMIKSFLRHARAKEALSALKGYAEQGKEPPAELVAVLRQPQISEDAAMVRRNYRHYGWVPVFLFGALSLGFAVMAVWPPDKGIPVVIMPFISILMLGLCLGNLVAMRTYQNQNRDRAPPP
jgi:hypothetical protein